MIVILIYIVLHIPAFVMLALALVRKEKHPESSKVLLIISGIYFLIGGGICGLLLTGI